MFARHAGQAGSDRNNSGSRRRASLARAPASFLWGADMLTPDDIGATIASVLGQWAEPAVYRVAQTFTTRAAALTAAGSTSITLNNLPAGFAPAAGDTFTVGATTHTVSAPATPAGGSVAVSFTPALASQVASGMQVVLTRPTDHPVRVIMHQTDGYGLAAGIWAGGDYRFTVFDLPADVEPKATAHRIVWRGKVLTVQADVSRDQTGAAWIVRAK